MEDALTITGGHTLDGFDQRRQGDFAIRGDCQIDLGKPAKILIVRLDVEIAGRDRRQLRAWLRQLAGRPMHLIPERVDGCPEVGHFEADDKVGFSNRSCSTLRLIERMVRREIHSPALIDDSGLERLGKLDEQWHRRSGPCQTVGNKHGIFCRDEKPRQFVDGARFSLRRRGHSQFGNGQLGSAFVRAFLQPGIEHKEDRRHRGRHRNLIRADCRLAEVDQRGRLIVPFREVADDPRTILDTVVPLCGPADRGVHVVAGHDVNRDAIAPGVVNRH